MFEWRKSLLSNFFVLGFYRFFLADEICDMPFVSLSVESCYGF